MIFHFQCHSLSLGREAVGKVFKLLNNWRNFKHFSEVHGGIASKSANSSSSCFSVKILRISSDYGNISLF